MTLGPVERGADVGVHRAVAVELAHPVDLGVDAEPRERAHEQLADEVARIARRRCCPAGPGRAPAARPCSGRPRRASAAPGRPSGRGRRRRRGTRLGRPASASARWMASWSTTPRRLPTWTVPDGVLESLTTWGPSRPAASSSAQNMRVALPLPSRPGPPGARQLMLTIVYVGLRRGPRPSTVSPFLLAQQRAADGRLVGDATCRPAPPRPSRRSCTSPCRCRPRARRSSRSGRGCASGSRR